MAYRLLIPEMVRNYQTRPLTPPEPAPIADLPADTLAKRSGYYVSVTPRNEIARFAERLLGIVQIDTTANGLSVNPALGTADTLLPVDAQRFRARSEPVASAVFARNQNGQMVLSGDGSVVDGNLRPISVVSAWGRWIATGLSLLLLASTLLFALYWIPAKALGRLGNRESIHLWLWPLVATLALAGAALALALAFEDPIRRLGTPTVYSIGYAGLTLTYGVAVLARLWALMRSKARAHWGTLAYHAFVVGAELLVLVYLAAHGLIGHRFWT